MSEFDLVIQNGTVVTAADTIKCDIGIKHGKILALAKCLTDAKESSRCRPECMCCRAVLMLTFILTNRPFTESC